MILVNSSVQNMYVMLISNLRDGVDGDFVSFTMRFLDSGIIGIFMGDEVSRFNIATVGVFALPIEYFFVEFNVVVVDGIVESDGYHLGYISGWQVARDNRAIFRAEAVRQHALRRVTMRSPIGIVVDIYNKIWNKCNKIYDEILKFI